MIQISKKEKKIQLFGKIESRSVEFIFNRIQTHNSYYAYPWAVLWIRIVQKYSDPTIRKGCIQIHNSYYTYPSVADQVIA